MFRLDERGVDILGKVKAGHGSPLGWPLTKKAIRYSDYTVNFPFLSPADSRSTMGLVADPRSSQQRSFVQSLGLWIR